MSDLSGTRYRPSFVEAFGHVPDNQLENKKNWFHQKSKRKLKILGYIVLEEILSERTFEAIRYESKSILRIHYFCGVYQTTINEAVQSTTSEFEPLRL
jgi:hypothetical protein